MAFGDPIVVGWEIRCREKLQRFNKVAERLGRNGMERYLLRRPRGPRQADQALHAAEDNTQ